MWHRRRRYGACGFAEDHTDGIKAARYSWEVPVGVIAQASLFQTVFPEDSLADSRPSCASPLDHSAQNFSESLPPPRASLSPSAMTTPTQPQTPVSTPPVPHGVGNPGGTPVVAPTRSKDKDGAASGTLGTFGVRLLPLHAHEVLTSVAMGLKFGFGYAGQVGSRADAQG